MCEHDAPGGFFFNGKRKTWRAKLVFSIRHLPFSLIAVGIACRHQFVTKND
jgi:hypothetical protein